MSEWLVLTLAMGAACLVVLIVAVVRHHAAPADEDPSETPDVIEYITMMIGVVYAIVLGLAIMRRLGGPQRRPGPGPDGGAGTARDQ